jgi:hypothetical protein
MHAAPSQHPRQFVLLGSGPWLRPSPVAQRVCGFLCLGAVVVMIVAMVLAQGLPPLSDRKHTLMLLFFGAGGLAFIALLTLAECKLRDGHRQYCPECLQCMRRGARVCPYCGLREEPASGASVTPRRSA